MNPYVDRLDEILIAPSYKLGFKKAPFQGHAFTFPGDGKKLRGITDKYLNEPLKGRAPVHFTSSPENLVTVAFYKYGRAQSNTQPEKGWLSYVEVLIGHDIFIYDGSDTMEAGFHLAFVYIGPATPEDSGAFPIVLGRECYGFAKNPGKIDYEIGGGGAFKKARLDVWDHDDSVQNGRLLPKKAISVQPDPAAKSVDSELLDRFHEEKIRQVIGDRGDLSDKPWRGRKPGEEFHVETPDYVVDPDKGHVAQRVRFVCGGTMLRDLVALKQIRDAASADKAAYQAVVKTRLIGPMDKLEEYDGIVDFGKLNRVKMWKELGCPRRGNRARGFYQEGQLTYADPKYTKTWPVP